MHNTRNALVIMLGTLLLPAVVFWSTLDGRAEGFNDVERHPVRAPEFFQFESAESIEPVPASPSPPPPLSPAEQDLVTWARHRFSLVGLELPNVEVAFHHDTEPCGGHTGRFRGDPKHRQIAVCVPDRGTFASHLQRQRTLVHELAHAWDHAHLDPQNRVDLLGILDASDWYAPELDWDERGVERFAETIVWGLYDQLRRPTLIDVACRELHADFQTITGFVAPGPLEQACDPTSDTQPRRSRPAPRSQPSRTETS